jgi:hypothetical protein
LRMMPMRKRKRLSLKLSMIRMRKWRRSKHRRQNNVRAYCDEIRIQVVVNQ